MRLPRTVEDQRPFATTTTEHFDRGQLSRHEAQRSNLRRLRVQRWAAQRGLLVVDSVIEAVVDGVAARAALYDITNETAIVRGAAVQPVTMEVAIEPASWSQRVRARFGASAFETGESSFDRQWVVKATDVRAAHRLLDEECREALSQLGCWCRATYRDGMIEVRVDAEQLAGTHLLGGFEIVLVLAQTRIHAAAYR